MISNGYVSVYMPDHPRSMSNGCVYEHIIQAEKKLGRFLREREVVHHMDRNRKNNKTENLIVFKTVKDHTMYHAGICVVKEGDVYIAVSDNKKYICPICGNTKKEKDSKMCIDCRNKEKSKNVPDKEVLINLLKKGLPYTQIGNMYGVSDNAVRKWCKKYKLPTKRSERLAYRM